MSKQWTVMDWSDECPDCGEGIEVLTDCEEQNQAYDGDEVRCVSCGKKGWVSADGGRAWVIWDGE